MSGMFFNEEEMSMLQAICGRLIPGAPGSPGAMEAKAWVYIDRALAGYFSHLQKWYRQRLMDMNKLSVQEYGKEFVQLAPVLQDDLLRRMENAELGENAENMKIFFQVLLEQTVEGMFGDPMYGGNHDFAGWKMIGFPGAQWGYTPEQMQMGYDSSRIGILSVSDLLERKKIQEKTG